MGVGSEAVAVREGSAGYGLQEAKPSVPVGYKQTEVGVIPEDWGVRNIGEIFQLINGRAFKPEDWKQNGTPIIRIQNLNDPAAPFNYSTAAVPEKNRVELGDLLFAWSGTIGTSFGARIWNGPMGVLNQHIFKVLMDEQQITLPFSLLTFSRIEEDIAKQAHGFKASFVHVKKADLVKVSLPLPSLPEQRAIATALSDMDALLDGLDRLIAKKRDLKQAAMQQLLTGQTRLPGFKAEWEAINVSELGEIVTGGTPSTEVKEFWGDGYPWITPTDISFSRDMHASERTLTRLGLSSIRALPANSVLVTCIASIGKNAILRSEGGCNQQINAVIPNENSTPEFLYYLFEFSKKYLLANAGTTATSIISKATFGEMVFLVPARDEQTAISTVLSDMDSDIESLQKRRHKTCDLKQAMMQELLTGRTRLI